MTRPAHITLRRARGGAIVLAAAAAGSAALLAATSSSAATAGTAAKPPACQTGGLVVWLNTTPNGAAGSVSYNLQFTNQSGHKCTLRGYPGLSAINLKGRQVGRSAVRDSGTKVKTITLKKGGTAQARFRITEAVNFPPAQCKLVSAAGLRVFPPNQRASKTVPFPFPACSKTGPQILGVQAIR
jgi:hypothetical protein